MTDEPNANEPAEATPGRGRRPRFDVNAKVHVTLPRDADNPLKAGKKNAEMLTTVRGLVDRHGETTVGAVREAGVPFGYLEFYARKGYVQIEGVALAAAAE